MKTSEKNRVASWLQLVRVPNLLTVPGDPLAGCLLAAGSNAVIAGSCLLAVVASLCLYAAGVVLNDIADLEMDRRERPARPLPSARISVRSAKWLVAILLASAAAAILPLGRAAWLVGAALAASIGLYDLLLKKSAVLGPVAMGTCRGLSVLLGAAAISRWSPLVWIAALVLAVSIGVLTALARGEVRKPDRPRQISFLIGLLLPLQALLVFVSHNPVAPWVAVSLLALWPLNRILNRSFYSS